VELVELAELTRATVAAVQSAADAAGVSLTLEAMAPVAVHGDPTLLRQLLLALLENAVRYTAPGGVVRCVVRAGSGSAELAVEDTGIGIPPEERPHVFERFFRGARAQARTGEGLGLGLALAAAIARRHHATIECEAPAAGGARFVVRFPAATTPAPVGVPAVS
jgi:signal transduction histidine kinase